MTSLSDLLKPIRERLEAATNLPWLHTHVFDGEEVITGGENGQKDICVMHNYYDAELIANSPTDLTKLLRVIEILDEALAAIAIDTPTYPSTTDLELSMVDAAKRARAKAIEMTSD